MKCKSRQFDVHRHVSSFYEKFLSQTSQLEHISPSSQKHVRFVSWHILLDGSTQIFVLRWHIVDVFANIVSKDLVIIYYLALSWLMVLSPSLSVPWPKVDIKSFFGTSKSHFGSSHFSQGSSSLFTCGLSIAFFVVSVALSFGCTVRDAEGMIKGACVRWMGTDCEGATSTVRDVAKREEARERPPTTRETEVAFSSRSSSSAEPSARASRCRRSRGGPQVGGGSASSWWREQCSREASRRGVKGSQGEVPSPASER